MHSRLSAGRWSTNPLTAITTAAHLSCAHLSAFRTFGRCLKVGTSCPWFAPRAVMAAPSVEGLRLRDVPSSSLSPSPSPSSPPHCQSPGSHPLSLTETPHPNPPARSPCCSSPHCPRPPKGHTRCPPHFARPHGGYSPHSPWGGCWGLGLGVCLGLGLGVGVGLVALGAWIALGLLLLPLLLSKFFLASFGGP